MISKRFAKRTLSLLLVLCMLLGLCPITVFAEAAPPPKNYISFGDSMTNGYGHNGYEWDDTEGGHPSVNVNGFRQNDVTTTYPAYLKEELDKTYDVNWEALAVSCMRTEDVNFLLRYHTDEWKNENPSDWGGSDVNSWNNTVKSKWDSTFIDDGNVIGDYFTWNEFVKNRFNDWGKVANDEIKGDISYPWDSNPTLAYARYYQEAVKNADVITLGTGNANFGVIMLQNITSLLTGTFGSGFKDAVPVREVLERRLPAEILPQALEILNKVDALVIPELGAFDEKLGDKAAKVLEIVEHTTVSFMFSYIDMLYAIDELNTKDNLDVIMMGLMNTMDGVKIKIDEEQIFDLGAVVDGITDVLSAYYFVLPVALQELNGDFENITFYIVPNDDHIEMQISDMADLEKIKQSNSNTIRERMIQEVSGMIFNLVSQPLNTALDDSGVQLPTWSMNDNTAYQYREKVAAYEALQKSYKDWVDGGYAGNWMSPMNGATGDLLENPNDMLACAVYLAFERAIIANANDATLDLAGLMSLMGGTAALGGMMDPIVDALTGENGAFGDEAQAALQGKVTASVAAKLQAQGLQPGETGYDEAVTQYTAMFTFIELTNALNGALGGALVDAESLGGLLSLFARMLIGNGIGSHPTANGHKTLFSEIMEVYPDTVAKDKLGELAQEYGAKLLAFLKENGANALKQVVGIAEQMDWLSAQDAELICEQIDKADEAIQSGDPREMLAYCVQLAEMLFEEYPEEMEALLDTVMNYVEELGAKLYDLVYQYGADALTNLVELLDENNVINAAQTVLLKQIISVCDDAFKSGDAGKVRECCGEVAALLYKYAVNEGYVPPVMRAAIALSARIFGRVQERVQTTAKVLQYINQRRMQTLAAIQRIIESFIERRNAHCPQIASPFGMSVWAPWTSMPLLKTPAAERPVAEEPIVEEPVIEEPIVEEPVIEEPIVEEPVVEEPIVEEPVVQEPEDEIELTVNVETETGRLLLLKWTKYTVQLLAESTGDTLHVTSVQYSTNNRTWKTGTEFTTTEKPKKVYVRVWDDCGGMTSFTYANGTVTKN